MRNILFASLLAMSIGAPAQDLSIGASAGLTYGHSMRQESPALRLDWSSGPWSIRAEDFGRARIAREAPIDRHIVGLSAVRSLRWLEAGAIAYRDRQSQGGAARKSNNVAPIVGISARAGPAVVSLDYYHALRDEPDSSHAWVLWVGRRF